jgi:hypothetical protein
MPLHPSCNVSLDKTTPRRQGRDWVHNPPLPPPPVESTAAQKIGATSTYLTYEPSSSPRTRLWSPVSPPTSPRVRTAADPAGRRTTQVDVSSPRTSRILAGCPVRRCRSRISRAWSTAAPSTIAGRGAQARGRRLPGPLLQVARFHGQVLRPACRNPWPGRG